MRFLHLALFNHDIYYKSFYISNYLCAFVSKILMFIHEFIRVHLNGLSGLKKIYIVILFF